MYPSQCNTLLIMMTNITFYTFFNSCKVCIGVKTQLITRPVTQCITGPVTQLITRPVTQSITRPVTQLITRPVTQLITRPVTQRITGPVTGYNALFSSTLDYVVPLKLRSTLNQSPP